MTQCGALKSDGRRDLVALHLASERPSEHAWAIGTPDTATSSIPLGTRKQRAKVDSTMLHGTCSRGSTPTHQTPVS